MMHEMRSTQTAGGHDHHHTRETPERGHGKILEVYPDPTNGPAWLVVQVPEGVEDAELRITDLSGRTMRAQRLVEGAGIVELQTAAWADGIYMVSLALDGHAAGSVKLAVQH